MIARFSISSNDTFFLKPLALVAVVFALYYPSLGFEFVYDDKLRILKDYLIFNVPFSLDTLGKVFLSPTIPGSIYRPVSTISFWTDGLIWGPNPFGFHLANIALHAAVVLLVYALFKAVFSSSNLSFCLSLLFGVHPVAVESVANVSGRPELLAALFALASVLLMLRAVNAKAKWESSVLVFLCGAAFFLGLLSKESAVVVLLLGPLLLHRRRERASPLFYCALFLTLFTVLGVFLVLRMNALTTAMLPFHTALCEAENPLGWSEISLLERIFPAAVYLGRYLGNIFWPVALQADYSVACQDFFIKVYSFPGWAPVLLLSGWIAACFVFRRQPCAVFGLWFLAAFAVTCNMVFPIGTIMGDRLCYLPLVGAVGFIGGAFSQCAPPRLKPLVLTVVFLFLVVTSRERIWAWKSDLVLFLQMAKEAPQNPKARESAGKEFLVTLGQRDRAEAEFLKAVEIDPSRVEALLFLAAINFEKGDVENARKYSEQVLKYEPENEEAKGVISRLATPAAPPFHD